MSPARWAVTVTVHLVNGQTSAVHLEARDLATLREVREVFDRAEMMCEQLRAEPSTKRLALRSA